MKTRHLFGVAALVCAVAAPEVSRAQVFLEGQGWRPTLDAQARVIENGIGTTFDFKDDLGMSDKTVPAGRLSWYGRQGFLVLGYDRATYSGDKVVERTIQFAGQNYTMGTRVISDLRMQRGYLQLGFEFLQTPEKTIRFGPMVEFSGFRFDGRLRAPDLATPLDESRRYDVPAPAAGLALDLVPTKLLRVFARGGLIRVGGKGDYHSAEAGFVLGPMAHLAVTGGYRQFKIHIDDAPDWADIREKGPYLGLAISF